MVNLLLVLFLFFVHLVCFFGFFLFIFFLFFYSPLFLLDFVVDRDSGLDAKYCFINRS